MNKKDERGIVIQNKVRLGTQGYTQEERIDYDEVFTPVARIEAIRLFLAYASFKDFVVYQMDVKSDFLYGKIEEEVYICQPPGFEDPDFPDRVYKVENALYGLHQAPKACHDLRYSMMLLVSNVMEFGVDVTDNNRICYTFLEREEALFFEKKLELDSLNIDYDQEEENQMKNDGSRITVNHGLSFYLAARDEIRVKTGNSRVNDAGHYLVLCCQDNLLLLENADFVEIVDFLNVNPIRTQSMATLNELSPQETGSGSGPKCQDTILGDAEAQTRFENASKQSNDLPLSRVNTLGSREDRLKLKELIDLCIKLSDRVLDLETIKTAQSKEIASLKKRVKKLERKRKSKTPGMNLFKIVTSSRRSLGSDFDEEFDANIDEAIEQVYDANKDTFEEGEVQVPTSDMEVNTASTPVTTDGVSVSTVEPITTASTLVKMRSEKSKVRGVVMQEPSETATRPTVSPQQHDPKGKGKAQMQAKLEEEERLAREREEDANIAEWDNAQAMMDADYDLATRIQVQEQEELAIEERSKLFVELMDKRKKHFARLKVKEQRRKPLTKAQKRNQMCTYLKNIVGFTHNQLRNKSFDEVQKAFDKTMSWIDSFVPVDSKVVKRSKDRAEDSGTRAEGSSKRAGEDLQ
ncbi:putative ribonuclease H-like domain-containing protein [Tanacetum coccineum]